MNKNPIRLPDLTYMLKTYIFDYLRPSGFRPHFKIFCKHMRIAWVHYFEYKWVRLD